MVTKIEAAQIASRAGIRTIIASSTLPNVLIDLVEGKKIGTLFLENRTTSESEKILTTLMERSKNSSLNAYDLNVIQGGKTE